MEELIQASRQHRLDDKVNNEIAVLKEAFARLQVRGTGGRFGGHKKMEDAWMSVRMGCVEMSAASPCSGRHKGFRR